MQQSRGRKKYLFFLVHYEWIIIHLSSLHITPGEPFGNPKQYIMFKKFMFNLIMNIRGFIVFGDSKNVLYNSARNSYLKYVR